MINHTELILKKVNDSGKMTTRGFMHLFTKPGSSGLLYVEVWGYKPGNGFCRYLDLNADDWQTYVARRLDAKGMDQIDGRAKELSGQAQTMPDSHMVKLVMGTLLAEKASDTEILANLKRFESAPAGVVTTEVEHVAYRIAYDRDRGGVSWGSSIDRSAMRMAEAPAINPSGSTTVLAPKATEVYSEWGAY